MHGENMTLTYKTYNMKQVGIIVVTYNRLKLLKKNIQSLREQTYQNRQIIVINNGSTDGTKQWLNEQNDLIVIHQDNLGGAGGFYTGLKYTAEKNFEYCWCMDDDVICQPTALEEFMNITKKLPSNEWGFLCSTVIDTNNNQTNVPEIDFRLSDSREPNWGEKFSIGLIKVRQASFVSVFIPTNIIYQYGLPLKDFFIWGDDTEYTTRLSNHLSCYQVGKSVVQHLRTMTQGLQFLKENNPNRLRLYFYMYRNQLFLAKNGYWRKNLPVLRFFISKGILLLKAILQLKFKHIMILLSAIAKAPFFNTKIEYPKINNNVHS